MGPPTFFLPAHNIVYAFSDPFEIIHATTGGGPGTATTILVYKVFKDGFESLDLGGSAVQSVVLMAIVIALTLAQFCFVERKIYYLGRPGGKQAGLHHRGACAARAGRR